MREPDAPLLAVLERSRALGFLGPGPVDAHVARARAFHAAVAEPTGRVVDLGSGGGVPGLVLARWWPATSWVLLDAAERRTGFLVEAVAELGLEHRVRVHRARAEEAGRDPAWRGGADLVVARSFGPPAVTAECAAPLLVVGGRLLVAEPPSPHPDRWPAAGLAELGLRRVDGDDGARSVAVLVLDAPCPVRYPRRTGIPSKRPLWGPAA